MKNVNNNKGVALILVLMFFFVMAIFTVSAFEVMNVSTKTAKINTDKEQAMLLAKSISEAIKAHIEENRNKEGFKLTSNVATGKKQFFIDEYGVPYNYTINLKIQSGVTPAALKIEVIGEYNGIQDTAIAYTECPVEPAIIDPGGGGGGGNPTPRPTIWQILAMIARYISLTNIIDDKAPLYIFDTVKVSAKDLISVFGGGPIIFGGAGEFLNVQTEEVVGKGNIEFKESLMKTNGAIYSGGDVKINNPGNKKMEFLSGIRTMHDIYVTGGAKNIKGELIADNDIMMTTVDLGDVTYDIMAGRYVTIKLGAKANFMPDYIRAKTKISFDFNYNLAFFSRPTTRIASDTITYEHSYFFNANDFNYRKARSDEKYKISTLYENKIRSADNKIKSTVPKAIEWTDLKTQVSTLVSQASDGATVAVPSASNVDVGAGKNIVNITAIDALKIDTTAGDVDVLLNGPTDTTIENLVINGGSGRVVRLFTAKNLTIGSNNTGNVTDISPNIQLYIISSNGDVNKGVTIGKKTSKFKAVIVAPDSKVRFTNTVKLSYSGNIIANSFEAGTSTANDNFEMQYVAPSDRFYALVRD